MFEKAEGVAQTVAGKIEEAAGAATEDSNLQARGRARRATGQVQQGYGEALDTVREVTSNSPITTLALAAGVGFVLGAVWTRRS